MALSAKYQSFLSAPSTGALAPDASINYVPTTTTVTEPTAILKHLSAQDKILKKKAEKVLSAIESSNGLCLDVAITLEFNTGGGAYLPGLDDNFLSDRTVTFPVVHIVQFDSQQNISSVRLYWDQASLLRQVDVIGSRARNWPIRDGQDQIRLISATAAKAPAASGASTRRNTNTGNSEEGSRPQTSRSNTSASATNDPHASLSLFQPREEDRPSTPTEYSVERVKSAKPMSRGLQEIISPEHQAHVRSSSPAKAGAGKGFQRIRLFDDPSEHPEESQERVIRANPAKYDHFQFGTGEDAPEAPAQAKPEAKSKKHTSQWGFEDFNTPEVTRTKILPQHTTQIGWSDNEEDLETPVKRPVVHKARKDADPHFGFDDQPTPVADKSKYVSGKGTAHGKGMGLYTELNNEDDDEAPKHVSGKGNKHNKGMGLYDEFNPEDDEEAEKNGPLGNVTKSANNEKRSKHFDSSFEITDSSPRTRNARDENSNGAEPDPSVKQRGINISGNGIGSKKDHEQATIKQRGINIGGDGMGGKKGTNRDWIFGADDGAEPQTTITGRKLGGKKRDPNQSSEKSFWDF